MNWEKYKDLIDFTLLKTALANNNVSHAAFGETLGISKLSIANWIHGRALPDTEQLAKVCAELRCSVDKVVRFAGYEVKDCYKVPWDGYGKPRWGKLTYEPLRMLFQGAYGEDWQKKMTEFYDIIPRPDLSEKQEANIQRRLDAAKKYWEEKAKEEGRGPTEAKRKRTGLWENYRADISMNRPIPLPRLYDICKALHCTPDWVMTYN